MAGLGSEVWGSTALEAGENLGVPLELRIVGGAQLADLAGRFLKVYGISPGGAVIVRPDGIVAWWCAQSMRVESTDGTGR